MFHVNREPQEQPTPPPHDVVPLFVNVPSPIRTDEDLERASAQEAAA